MSNRGWIGVDFDGTLSEYTTWVSAEHTGAPIAAMVERVKAWRAAGQEVRIFTARVFPVTTVFTEDFARRHLPVLRSDGLAESRYPAVADAVEAIQKFCRQHLGEILPITCVKDFGMIELYDDRCVQVRPNTGELVGESTRGL